MGTAPGKVDRATTRYGSFRVCGSGALFVQDLCEFLGVDPTFDVDVTTLHNRGVVPRSLVANRILVRTGLIVHDLLPTSMRYTGITERIQRLLLRRPEHSPRPFGGNCWNSS